MDRAELDVICKDAITPRDWLETPRAVQAFLVEMAQQIRFCREQIESYQEQVLLHKEQIQQLKDEIARLKGHNSKPDMKPSNLENPSRNKDARKSSGQDQKRPGSAKRSKTKELQIHKTEHVKPKNLPPGSKLKDYQDWVVQDILIEPRNVCYRLERWETPDGKSLVGKLPEDLGGGHFGSTLVCFILYQYHHARVTQPMLLEQLYEFGIDISAGQLSTIITRGKERFHTEKDEILRVGLKVSSYVNVDDTGARHNGNNGYCTHIGNELFAWFESTGSKSRINFLKLLRAGRTDYVINDDALNYMHAHKLPKAPLETLTAQKGKSFANDDWEANLKHLDITSERHTRIITEGALIGSLLEHGFKKDMVIMSDDAGQFNVLLHALCWVHSERTINKLIPVTDRQRDALDEVRSDIWDLYADLKAYKEAPNEEKKAELETRFDSLFTKHTCYASLNEALARIHKNKNELLLVLRRPDLPLHNNLSESDIREYVTRRKISGSTRSDFGRRCRDTFTSLKKTCRKLGISFWKYLEDRISNTGIIPRLGDIIRRRVQEAKLH